MMLTIASIIDYAALLTCTAVGICLMVVCGVLVGVRTRDESRLQRWFSKALLFASIAFGLYMAVWALDGLVTMIITTTKEG